MNFTLRLLAALLLFSGSMAAQTDMFVASDDTPVLSVNDLAVDPETGDQYMLMTLSDSGADAQEPLHFQAPDGTELSSGFTWTPQGGRDACLARVTADGDFLWACAIGSTLDDELFGIALDGEGNLAVTGYVQGDLEIQEGSGSITQIDLDEANNQDCFTALFTTDGDLMWYRVDGGSGSDLGRKIDFCGSGWGVLGAFEAGDAAVGGQLLTPDTPDQSDFFLLQTDQAGEPVWTTHWGSDLPDFNTYRYIWNNLGLSFVDDRWFAAFPWNDTACAFYDSSGQPFDGVALTSPYSGLNQGVVCVNSNGFYNWSQSIVSSDDAIHGMCLVANTDGVYVAGTSPGFYVGDVADFTAYHSAPSVDDPYVLKLNFWDGSEMFCSWVDFGTPDQSGVAKTVALAQSEDGSLTLAGYTGADYNEPVIVAETLVADYDAFMASMDALGTVTSVWVSERTGPDGIVALSSTSFGVAAVGASASTKEESTGSLGMFSFASTCSTPPSAGTIVQNSFAVCSGQSITLASTGTLGDLKWQKKVMSGNWVDLPLATTSTFEYTPSSSTSFRLEASNPGCLISYSEEIEVTLQAVVFATVSCPPSPQQEEADPCTYFHEVQDYTSGITLGACSTGSITQTPAAGSLVSVGSHTVTLEHSDGATVSNCSFTLEVSGPSAGVVSLADQAVGLGASCTYTMENFSDLATVSGGCAGDTWDIYHAFTGDAMPGQTLMAGTYTIHFEALGSGGGFAFGAFELTVVDQSAPEFDVLVDDMLVLVADDCTAPKPDVVSLLDAFDCSGVWYDATYVNTVTGETVLDSETTLEIGAYEVHLTFSDALANAVDYAFDLKVVDGDGPELVQLQTEITAACMYAVPNWVSAGVIDASDACSSFSITGQSPAQGTFLVAPYDLSNCAVIAEDAFGNETVFPFSLGVDVQDVPALSNLSPTFEVSATSLGCAGVMPDLSGTYTIESCTSYSDWVAFQTPVQGSTISNGQVATVYLAHPITGETTTPLYTTLEIVDDTAPVMTCSAVAVDVELTEDCAGWTLANADLVLGISDNCSPDGAIDKAYSHAENIVYPLTETTVQVTATDEAGNASSCSVNVTPVDVTAPEIICPSDVVLEFPEDGSNLILPELSGMASAVDCGIDLPTVASLTAGSEFTELEDGIVLTYTATDANGNSNSCTSTLSIVDTTSPDVAPIANQSVAVDANCLSVLPDFLDLVVATDLVSGIVDMVQEPAAGTVFGGELSVTITVQDGAGNSSSVDFIASATDQTPPTVSCPGMSWIELSDVCDYLVPDYTAEVTVLDNCSMSYTYSQSPEVGESIMPLNALQHIEVSVTDEAGNTGVCLAYIWINDGFAPEISCGEDLTFLLSENTAPLELNAPFDLTANATLTNECPGEVVVVATADQLELAPGESTVVALEVSDENDNASTCEYTVYFVDDVAPALTPLDAVTLYTDASDCGQFELPDFASVLDVFDHSEYSLIQNPAAGTYFVVADVVEVELTATDVFGNTASTTLEVTIETPFPGGLPTDAVNVNLLLDCAWELPNYIPEAALSDACGSTWEVLQIPEAGTQLSAGQTYTVHFEMADAPGVSLASFEVTVEDSQAPVWDCPTEAFEVQTTANTCLAELDIPIPEVNDNCTVTVIELQSDALPTQASPGSYWVTYRAYDPAGNFSDCTFEVQVVDATPPALVCPDPVSIDLPDDGSGWAFPEASSLFAAIDCTPWADLIFTQSIAAGTVFTTSQQGVECDVTVTDAAGNMAQCTLVYTLIDQSAPQLQPIADQELDAGSMCSNIMPDYTLDLVILEGAESVINSVQSPSPGSPVVGSTPVNITVYAASGTSSELNFNVDLVDVYAPIIDCGGLQFIELTDACGYTVPDFTSSVTLSDNCSAVGDITLTQFVTPGSELYPWTSVQYVGIAAMDEAGNESMCNVQLWITDAMPPEITCVEHQEVLLSTVDVYPYPVPDALLPAVFDPCFGGTSLSASQSAFELEAGQTCTYFFYTSDGAGNEADCSYNLTLLDDVDPVVDALSDTTIFTFNTDCSQFTLPDFTPLVNAWDHSEIVEISQWPMPGDYSSDLAPAEVLVKVMDSAGNITYIGFTVHVEPTAPAFIPVSNDYIELGSTCSIPLPQYLEDNGFVDACGVFWPIVQVPSPGTEVFPGDFIEVEFYLADALDSAPVGSLVLTLVDAIAPEWTCPTLEPVFTVNEDDCLAQVHIQTPEVFDYCGVESIEVIAGLAAGSLPPGQYQVTFEATDPAGLTSTCSVDYSVLDNSAPVMECAQPVLSCEAVVSFDMPVVFDVCDDDAAQPVLVSDPDLVSGAAFPEGITEVIFEATDAAGNSAACTTFVEVNVMSFDFEMPFDAICKSADPVQLEISGEGEATWGGAISASGVLNPNAIGPGEHVATLTVSDGTCEVTQDFPFTVDETPEVTFTNLPDMWCLDGGPVELLYETNPGATWEWTAGVGADGILDPTGMAVGTVELTLSGNLGSCVAEEMAVVELVEGISFTWTDLPSSLCSHNEAIPLEVNAPAGSTVDFNDVVTKTGTFDPQSWSAGEQTITVSVALPGCFASDSQTVTVVEPPTVFAGDDDEICGPVTTVQGACSDPFAAVSWSGPAGTSFSDPTAWMTTVTYNPMGGVDLTYTVTSGGVCTASDVVHLHFTRPPAQPDAGPDQDLELVSESSMEGFYQGPGKAHWRSLDHLVNLSDSSDLESPVTNLQHGINRFHLVASSGKCPPRVDSVEIRVNLVWQIPSGFSPNGDRTNDFFVIDGLDGPASLDVVNRWGELVYRAKNYHNQWDGRSSNGSPLPDDTYFYILKVGDQVFDGYIIIKR